MFSHIANPPCPLRVSRSTSGYDDVEHASMHAVNSVTRMHFQKGRVLSQSARMATRRASTRSSRLDGRRIKQRSRAKSIWRGLLLREIMPKSLANWTDGTKQTIYRAVVALAPRTHRPSSQMNSADRVSTMQTAFSGPRGGSRENRMRRGLAKLRRH